MLGFVSQLPTLIAVVVGGWLIYFCVSFEYAISCTLDKKSSNFTLENFSVLKQVKVKKIPLASIRKIELRTKPDFSPSNDPGDYNLIINVSSGGGEFRLGREYFGKVYRERPLPKLNKRA